MLENGCLFHWNKPINNKKEEFDLLVISKHYWFIKWLVENDKVDFELDRIVHKHKWIDYNTWKWIVLKKLCSRYESLLMMLSIQSYPIEFLISILK
jgi:hypothetical protein